MFPSSKQSSWNKLAQLVTMFKTWSLGFYCCKLITRPRVDSPGTFLLVWEATRENLPNLENSDCMFSVSHSH